LLLFLRWSIEKCCIHNLFHWHIINIDRFLSTFLPSLRSMSDYTWSLIWTLSCFRVKILRFLLKSLIILSISDIFCSFRSFCGSQSAVNDFHRFMPFWRGLRAKPIWFSKTIFLVTSVHLIYSLRFFLSFFSFNSRNLILHSPTVTLKVKLCIWSCLQRSCFRWITPRFFIARWKFLKGAAHRFSKTS
jgi:hypothetical protein